MSGCGFAVMVVNRLLNCGGTVLANSLGPPGTVSNNNGIASLNSAIALSGVMVCSQASDISAAATCFPTPRRSGSCSPKNPCSSFETQTMRFSASSTNAAHRLSMSTSIHLARRASMFAVAMVSMTRETRRPFLEEGGDALEEIGGRGCSFLQPLLDLQLRVEIVVR